MHIFKKKPEVTYIKKPVKKTVTVVNENEIPAAETGTKSIQPQKLAKSPPVNKRKKKKKTIKLNEKQYTNRLTRHQRESRMGMHKTAAALSLATSVVTISRGLGQVGSACKAAVAANPLLLGIGVVIAAASLAYFLWIMFL